MSIGELLTQGGATMVPIYLCFVVVLAVFIKKFLELRCANKRNILWLNDVLEQVNSGKLDDVKTTCAESPHPAARVAVATARALKENPEKAQTEARRVGSLEIQRLEKDLSVLSFMAQVAPLLGLLGTVLGMVDLFINLQGAGQTNLAVSDLSSGIWKALLTTAAGLTVAVPALASHTFLTSRTDAIRLQLSDVIQQMLYVAGPSESANGGRHGL
tara:strand:- start:777 stop:1421 length:645 start_codon:yes stop_codon:yes gene_type:complete